MYETPLKELLRNAARSRARYLKDPEYRLAAINKKRRRDGRPELSSLDESRKLRLPLEAR